MPPQLRHFIAGLLDQLADWLDGPTVRVMPCCRCPVCGKDIQHAEPHLHGRFTVAETEWPKPGVLVTVEPE